MAHQPVKGIDLMKSISDKRQKDLQQVMSDTQKNLKKNHKKPAM
jgi:hypothetical protein